jgi:hypothetical protein
MIGFEFLPQVCHENFVDFTADKIASQQQYDGTTPEIHFLFQNEKLFFHLKHIPGEQIVIFFNSV